MNKFYAINDEYTDQILSHWDEDYNLWEWDACLEGEEDHELEDIHESARFKNLGDADCVCKKLTEFFLKDGTPADEIDFRVYVVSVEVIKRLYFEKGPPPPKGSSPRGITGSIKPKDLTLVSY